MTHFLPVEEEFQLPQKITSAIPSSLSTLEINRLHEIEIKTLKSGTHTPIRWSAHFPSWVTLDLVLEAFHLLDIVNEPEFEEDAAVDAAVCVLAAIFLRVKFHNSRTNPYLLLAQFGEQAPTIQKKVRDKELQIVRGVGFDLNVPSIGRWIDIICQRFNAIVNELTQQISTVDTRHRSVALHLALRFVSKHRLGVENPPRTIAMNSFALCLLVRGSLALEFLAPTGSFDVTMWNEVNRLKNELRLSGVSQNESPHPACLAILGCAAKCGGEVLGHNALVMLKSLISS